MRTPLARAISPLSLILAATLTIAAAAEPTSLPQAADDGDADAVREILAHGGDVNAPDARGETALQHAALRGHDAIVRLLVGAGADVNAGAGEPPLLSALRRSPETARFLVEHGADVRRGNQFGAAPIHFAVTVGWQDGVVMLLDRGVDVNARTGDGDTPLSLAAYGGKVALVRLLLERGAEVDARNARFETPLIRAAVGGGTGDFAGATRLLLDRGADVGAADTRGWTALYHALFQQREAVVTELLTHGARTDLRDNQGKQALHVAAERGNPRLVTLVLEHGGDLEGRDNEGNSPLHDAARRGDVPTIELLLARGADPLATATNGSTALNTAIGASNHAAATLLRERQLSALDREAVAPTPRPVADTNRMYKGAMFVDPRRGYVFGTGYMRGESSLVATEDGGATWRLVMDYPHYRPADSRLPDVVKQKDDIWALSFLDQQHFWVRTLHGEIHRTRDGGRTFEVFKPDLVDPVSGAHITSWVDAGLQFVSADVGYAVAAANVFRTGDGGRTWSARPVPKALGMVTQIWFFDAANGIATTTRGYEGVVRTTDGGKTWTGVANAPSFDRLSCTRDGFCAGFGLRDNGGSFLLVSADRGRTWRDTELRLAQGAAEWSGERISDMQAISPHLVVLVGRVEERRSEGLLLSWTDGPWVRQRYSEPRQIDGVWFVDSSSAWLVAHDEKRRLYQTADGGRTLHYVADYFSGVEAPAERADR